LALTDAVEALAAEPERDGDGARRRIDEVRRMLGESPGGDDRRRPAPPEPGPSTPPKETGGRDRVGLGGPGDADGTDTTHQDLQRALE
jgi:hypothetical protein